MKSCPFGYQTDIAGKSVARIVYRDGGSTAGSDSIHELRMAAANDGTDSGWTDVPLTTGGNPFPSASSSDLGSITAFTTGQRAQDEVAHVVYLTDAQHIEELRSEDGTSWHPRDLTYATGAPSADTRPIGYETTFAGQSVTRVVYGAGGHIWELSSVDGVNWSKADLSVVAGAVANVPNAAAGTLGQPFGYASFVPDAYARVVYITDAGHVEELSLYSDDPKWRPADLTTQPTPNAPLAVGSPVFALEASLGGRTGANLLSDHVIFLTQEGDVEDLSLGSSRQWKATDLTVASSGGRVAPAKAALNYACGVVGYYSFMADQGQVSDGRIYVDYQTTNWEVWQLSEDPYGAHAAEKIPTGNVMYGVWASRTRLTGQGDVNRIIYVSLGGKGNVVYETRQHHA
jgi:hypothetical protein